VRTVRSLALVVFISSPADAAIETSGTSIPTAPSATFLAVAIGAMVACALSSFFLVGRVSERTHIALAMLIVLIGAFCLLVLFGEAGRNDPLPAVLIMAALIGMFKLMNRFEARSTSRLFGSGGLFSALIKIRR